MHGTSDTPPQYVTVDRLGVFFYWTRFIWQHCTVWQSLQFIWSICSGN